MGEHSKNCGCHLCLEPKIEFDPYERIAALEKENAELRAVLKESALHAHNQTRRADDTLDELKVTVSELSELREAAAWYLECEDVFYYLTNDAMGCGITNNSGLNEIAFIWECAESALRTLLKEEPND